MNFSDIQGKLLAFNSDPKTQAIRNFYTKKSFLEILAKSRNETAHTAFLAWLLQGDAFPKEDAPLLRFLNVLVKNADGTDSPVCTDNSLKAAILSGTLEYADVKATLEQTVKEISTIPSRDRLDLYLTATLSKPVCGKKYLRIIVENKIFSEEIFSEGLHQTLRYYSAVAEHPKDDEYNKEALSLFVFLTPSTSRATDAHFIPVSYQDLMDYVLEPLAGNAALDNSTKTYLQEYINALSVPSISDDDNELTVLAVSKGEKERLEKFWDDYKDIITEAANSNKSKLSADRPEDMVLQKFYEKNQPLFTAIYHVMPQKAEVLKPFTTRDYTKYTLKFDGEVIGEHLGKRAVVLLAAQKLITEGFDLPEEDNHHHVFFYEVQAFEEKYRNGQISEDTYKNRYTMVDTPKGKFAIRNQWGVGNWDFVEDILLGYGFSKKRFDLLYE